MPLWLHAQDVTGVLRAEPSGVPMEGVVVTAMRATDRALVGRTLSGSAGSFRLRVGTDSVVVMALRIGQQPIELWRGRLAAGERRDIGQSLPYVPVTITSLQVREGARCGMPLLNETSVTRTLFADALTALTASLGSADGEALRVRTMRTEEFRDLRGVVQRAVPPVVQAGTSTQPFRSVPVATLMREGFAVTERDGGVTYRAPDAHVLTSDLFLQRYCLSLDLSREADGLVGIQFEPQRTASGQVDVEGALWLDLSTRALRQLEFRYRGLARAATDAAPGGLVEYVQLADGRWIIDRWSLRMPVVATELVGSMRVPLTRATGVQVVGGLVLEARLRSMLLYSAGGEAAEQAIRFAANANTTSAVADNPRSRELHAPTCPNTDATVAHVSGVVRYPDGTAVADAQVEAEWRTRFRPVAGQSWTWETARVSASTGADGRFTLCDVPRDARVSLLARTETVRTRAVVFRVPLAADNGEVELTLPVARRAP
jgi:hypothetical protein